MNGPTKELDAFRGRHDLRVPNFIRHRCETIRLEPKDGLRLLGPAPAMDVLTGTPPSSSNETFKTNRYLWVIDIRGIPYIIEAPREVRSDSLQTPHDPAVTVPIIGHALPKHTNLTEGGEAYLGGEMWFTSSTALYISGGSGRYPPTDRRQLEEATRVFQAFGYGVASLGWDDAIGRARRVLDAA